MSTPEQATTHTDPPPFVTLFLMMTGYYISRAIYVTAALGMPICSFYPSDGKRSAQAARVASLLLARRRGVSSLPIQRPVLNCFCQVSAARLVLTCEVCDSTRDLENARVGARAQTETGHGALQELFPGGVGLTKFTNVFARHLRIAV